MEHRVSTRHCVGTEQSTTIMEEWSIGRSWSGGNERPLSNGVVVVKSISS